MQRLIILINTRMNILINLINIFLIGVILSFLTALSLFIYFGRDLPDFGVLTTYEPPVVSKIFAADGNFLEEYSRENRVYTNFENIPTELINSFIVAEDKNFFSHKGFDLKGILRASIKNTLNIFTDKRPEGASTITQQVAKNVLLSNEITYTRKIKEIILSLRIERSLSKEKIIELYLNEIYLGNRSFGVASASINYFSKPLNELNIAEMSLLAALPKAPSTYNPFRNPNKSLKRRNWVITRLFNEDLISREQYENSINMPLNIKKKKGVFTKKASFFKEAVRREIIKQYDEKKLYDQGLSIMSTLDTKLQFIAEETFKEGIRNYDKTFGWRGPIENIIISKDWVEDLKKVKQPKGLYENLLAVVIKLKKNGVDLGFSDGSIKFVKYSSMDIIQKKKNIQKRFTVGDIVSVKKDNGGVTLTQIPKVNGGLIVIENQSGKILAMVGGYDSSSAFNRVTQAMRQPGSAFKPIVYTSALENGFSPIDKILDAPIVIENPTDKRKWRPTNYGNKFYGPSTLRLGIEKSRNLMTVRLANKVGLNKIKDLSEELRIYRNLPLLSSSSLGSVETSLQRLTLAYSIIANGGFLTTPTLIDKIQDKNGKVIFKHEKRKCRNCLIDTTKYTKEDLKNYIFTPEIEETRKKIISSQSAYQMTNLLMGVLKRGTAKNLNYLDFEVAGKTGTTNNNQDAWFIGYTSEITVGVYVGYDSPQSLGKGQTGSNVAAPIFGKFMKKVYSKYKPRPFTVPEGIKFVNIDLNSGLPSDKNFIQEVFKNDFSFDKSERRNIEENLENDFQGFY